MRTPAGRYGARSGRRRRRVRRGSGGATGDGYDPGAPVGEGRTIIEASAGTGKTFTIAAIVARLVAEEGLPLERILVVTFTRAATAELKDRIRGRLLDTLRALRADPSGVLAGGTVDDHMRVLLESPPERRARYADRLDQALTHFDRAQILTIHSFARRLLQKLGLRSRLPEDLEAREIDEMVVRRAAGDLVVGRFAVPDPAAARGPEAGILVSRDEMADIGKVLVTTPDVRIIPDPSVVEGAPRVRAEMAGEIQAVCTNRLRAEGSITFDDALVEARDALSDARIGAGAREVLRKRYSIALVDEAQDTDPIQWQVLRAVFDESRLVVIGDPKQSIYAFRGADIESYLSAVDGATDHRTLETNWRSDRPLIKALDTLLDGATFGDARIGYRRVLPAGPDRSSRIRGTGEALEIRRFSKDFPLRRYQRKPFFHVAPTRKAVARDAAAEVVRLLDGDAELVGDDGDVRSLGPGDIAVLCRTGRQVAMVREELSARSVPSVVARTGSVFDTAAAEQWRRFLLAVERPSRTAYLRLAATTVLVGMTPGRVADLPEEAVLDLQQSFVRWRALLHDHGVPTMFADIDRSTGLTARILARFDGERDLTDVKHIAEEMHAAWRGGRIGSLGVWIEAAMDEATRNAEANVEDPESRQRRLDTDSAAVQVLTVHAAKGLEYRVVMVPYLWDIPRIPPRIPIFHDAGPAPAGKPKPRLADVGGPESPDFTAHKEAALSEQKDEEGRLLYVALTRAKHRLVLWWIENTRYSSDTELHRILTRGGDPDLAVRRLVGASEGTIGQTVLTGLPPKVKYKGEVDVARPPERARFERPLDYSWRRVSFSSLSPDHPLDGQAVDTDETDRVDETDGGPEPVESGGGLVMAELPRGPRFGSLVHDVFQHVPFDAPDLPATIGAELARLTRHASWDFDDGAFVEGIAAAMNTPLGPRDDAPALRDLDPGRTLKEMDFEMPLRTRSTTISLPAVAEVVLEHLPRRDLHRPYFARLGDLAPQGFRGFLTGGIDLISVLPGPAGDRYTVMDFKSNTLPNLEDMPGPADYGPRPLVAAMHHGNYPLQALLYQVALHRYLQWRLDGYDPSAHLGGSVYLFVRGMIGAGTPVVEGERCGVARWTPPPGMIVAVSDLFAGR